MPDNVRIFLPLLLYGIAVVLGLRLCYLAAPRGECKRSIQSQVHTETGGQTSAVGRPSTAVVAGRQRILAHPATRNTR